MDVIIVVSTRVRVSNNAIFRTSCLLVNDALWHETRVVQRKCVRISRIEKEEGRSTAAAVAVEKNT